jgi:hypothetical protein
MNLIVVILLVAGIFLIMHGVYEERYQELRKHKQVEYRFIPRSYYDEQLFGSDFKDKMAGLNTDDSQWYHRNIGKEMSIDRMKL